jgi:hypothetical protein
VNNEPSTAVSLCRNSVLLNEVYISHLLLFMVKICSFLLLIFYLSPANILFAHCLLTYLLPIFHNLLLESSFPIPDFHTIVGVVTLVNNSVSGSFIVFIHLTVSIHSTVCIFKSLIMLSLDMHSDNLVRQKVLVKNNKSI